MKMRAGALSSVAYGCYLLTGSYNIPFFHSECFHVSVNGAIYLSVNLVLQNNPLAKSAGSSSLYNFSVACRVNRRAYRTCEVYSLVFCAPAWTKSTCICRSAFVCRVCPSLITGLTLDCGGRWLGCAINLFFGYRELSFTAVVMSFHKRKFFQEASR